MGISRECLIVVEEEDCQLDSHISLLAPDILSNPGHELPPTERQPQELPEVIHVQPLGAGR